MENPFETILNRLDHLEELILKLKSELKPETPKRIYSEDLVSQKEIAAFLSISEPTVLSLRRKRLIPFKRIGRRYLFNKNDVSEAADKGSKYHYL